MCLLGMVADDFNLSRRQRQMISLSWRPAWSTKEVLGHQGYMLRPFLKNKTKEQQQQPPYANVLIF